MIPLVATRSLRYDGRRVLAGARFHARSREDARVLKAVLFAADAPPVREAEAPTTAASPAPPTPAAESPPPESRRRRAYRRRDLTAESPEMEP